MDRMRDLAGVTLSDHVLEPSAGRGRLIARLPRQQQITAIEIDPNRVAHLAMMPHFREGAMSVSQTNFLNHIGKRPGYFGTFFNAILMAPPRRQNDDLRHVMAAWDCLAPAGTLVAVVSPGWECPANEAELLLFRAGLRRFTRVRKTSRKIPSANPRRRFGRGWAVREPRAQ